MVEKKWKGRTGRRTDTDTYVWTETCLRDVSIRSLVEYEEAEEGKCGLLAPSNPLSSVKGEDSRCSRLSHSGGGLLMGFSTTVSRFHAAKVPSEQ